METLIPKLTEIKTRLLTLKENYDTLKISHEDLKAERDLIIEENKTNLNKLSSLDEQLNILKLSKSMSGSSEDTTELKKKLNEFIREIDKCLALLNN